MGFDFKETPKLVSLTFTVLILSFTLFVPKAYALSLPFQDDFGDGNVGPDWQVKNYTSTVRGSFGPVSELNLDEIPGEIKIDGTGTIDVVFIDYRNVGWIGKSLISIDSIDDEKFAIETSTKVESNTDNFELFLVIEFDQNNRIFLILKSGKGDDPGRYIQVAVDENQSVRCINQTESSGPASLCPTRAISYNFSNGQWVKPRIEFDSESNIYSVYVDGQFILSDVFLGNTTNDPHVGIAAAVRFPGDQLDARFDYFKTEQLDNQLNVPDVKQIDPQWSGLTYDTPSNWNPVPSDKSIGRWGCALTSASMILKYHGYDFNPDALNEWFTAQNGYTRNGALIWPAVGKLTKLREDLGHPALEFKYLSYSQNLIEDEINNERPAVLKLLNDTYGGNHFLVAKGYNNSDIFINDPGTYSNDTLSDANSYWGDTVRLGQFTPSNTDLSYIVLMLNEDFEMKVTSESGEIAGDEFYFQEGPMMNPENPDEDSGVETLNAFYYPKPESGEYKVDIEGVGDFQLDYYLYDSAGEVKTGSFYGSLDDGKPNNSTILLDKNNVQLSGHFSNNHQTLITYWQSLYDNGFVSNHGLYKSVKKLIENSHKNKDKRGMSSMILLEAALNRLRLATPDMIDETASSYMQDQIQTLLENL